MSARPGLKSHHETEIKLPVQNVKALRRHLRELGFQRVRARYFESNHLFDFPDQRLRKARCLLRLRFEGTQSVLTFKGAPLRSDQYKIRREVESHVGDALRVKEILGGLGLEETFSYEKYRTVYAPGTRRKASGPPYLVYDETPVGNYLELEGPAPWIDKVARQLGFTRDDYITSSYAALYWQKCLKLGKKPGNMVFSNRKS